MSHDWVAHHDWPVWGGSYHKTTFKGNGQTTRRIKKRWNGVGRIARKRNEVVIEIYKLQRLLNADGEVVSARWEMIS